MNDLTISGNACKIDCRCSRWDQQSYSIIIETWMDKSDLQSLEASVIPGAVSDIYAVTLGHSYYDTTWTGKNTIRLIPIDNTDSTLWKMRKSTGLFCKTLTTSPINPDWISVKIEGMKSGAISLGMTG